MVLEEEKMSMIGAAFRVGISSLIKTILVAFVGAIISVFALMWFAGFTFDQAKGAMWIILICNIVANIVTQVLWRSKG